MGLFERERHVGDTGCYTAVGESCKYDRESQVRWEQHGKSRMPCAILYVETRSPRSSSTSLEKEASSVESCLMRGVAKPFHEFNRKFVNVFNRPRILGEKGRRYLYYVFKVGANKSLVKGEEMLGVSAA